MWDGEIIQTGCVGRKDTSKLGVYFQVKLQLMIG